MRDKIGNKITDHSLLCWHPSLDELRGGLMVQVVSVTDGGLSLGDSQEVTTPMLIVQIPIFVNSKPNVEATLSEFLCVVNPQAEAEIEKMLAGKPTQ